jgi:hypothetical protein
MNKSRIVATLLATVVGLVLQGCYTAPAPVPAPQRSISERFEQSWQAARGAASDRGVRVTHEDRPSGTLRGDKGSSSVVITVITQADATIQVGFSVTGGDSYQDSTLKNELTQAYQRRMGR